MNSLSPIVLFALSVSDSGREKINYVAKMLIQDLIVLMFMSLLQMVSIFIFFLFLQHHPSLNYCSSIVILG